MCVACVEYIKGSLRLNEYKSALREFAGQQETSEHAQELQTILYDHDGSEDDLKKKIQTKIK